MGAFIFWMLVLVAVVAFYFYRSAKKGKAVAKAQGEEIQSGLKALLGYAEVGRQEIRREKAERRQDGAVKRQETRRDMAERLREIQRERAEKRDRDLASGSVTAGRAGMVTFAVSGKFLVVKRPLSTKRIPLATVTHVDTTPLSVIIYTDREAVKIPTQHASDVADLINEAIPEVTVNRMVLS